MSTVPEALAAFRPTWAEIDLDAFARNVASIRSRLPAGSNLIAVLKADGYGHGAIELAPVALQSGAAMLAVALVEEAVELRRSGVQAPILILGPAAPQQLQIAEQQQLTLGIIGPNQLRQAGESGRKLDIHLKLDSGMGRMGLVQADLPEAARILKSAPQLRLRAIYTHYANASDPRDPLTEEQRARFTSMLAELRQLGVTAPIHHSANSPATMRGLVSPGDWARVGMSLYGGEVMEVGSARLEPVLRWRTEIARLKEVPEGAAIGYGATFRAPRPGRIATLPVGYADGYSRLLSNNGEVLIRGHRAPVVGRVSMDLVTVDVSAIRDATVSDPVVLLGRDGDDEISAEELARKTGTIAYEVFCRISVRVPRVYLSDRETMIKSKFLDRVAARISPLAED